MKNLKKILALVLALMMVMSMMVTASAAKFEDDAEISYLEAVEVMAAAGVLKGYEAADGTFTFKPEGTLTRAEAAKIIAYVLNGGELDTVAADALVNPFEDVSGWAEPYIAYIASEGIVDGNGGGKYYPKGTLTGYEFAKMLLNVLGIEGTYTGKEWKLNVALNAQSNKLLAGLAKDFALKNEITREEAAQMAFNALKYSATVEYGYAVLNGQTVVGYFDSMIEAATAAAVLGQGYTYGTTPVELPGEALIDGYKLKTTADTVGIGYKGYYWYVDKNGNGTYNSATESIVSSFVCTDTVVGTYTVADSYKVLAADLGMTTDGNLNSYVNGSAGNPVAIDIDSTTKVLTDSDTTMTAVVRADGTTIELLYATEYLATVTRGQKDTTANSATYGLYPFTFTYDNNQTKVVYGAADKYNTRVTYLIIPTTVPVITEAKYVVGPITAIAAGLYARVGTEVIYLSDANALGNLQANANTYKTVYLNSNGDLIGVGNYSAAATIYDGYAYLTNVEYLATAYSATGLVGSGNEASISAKAKIVTPAGETLTVDVGTDVYTLDGGANYYVEYYLDGWQSATCGTTAPVDAMAETNNMTAQWVAYTVEDGVYYFDTMSSTAFANAAAKTATVDIDNTKHFMDANTVITFVNYNIDSKAIETSVVTGYANITSAVAGKINNGTVAVVVADPTSKVVESITIYGTARTTASVNFAVYAGQLEVSGISSAYDTYGFYVNGVLSAYYLTSANVVNSLQPGAVVAFETNAQGKVQTATAVSGIQTLAVTNNVVVKAISADGTYFIDSNDNVHTLGTGYVVYNTAANGYAIDELVVGQTVTVIKSTTAPNPVLAIFVEAQPSV